MNYIIYDLEFNHEFTNNRDGKKSSNSSLMFEIIQIGAVKLNENFESISTFNALIKPTLYTSIHPYIENLTKITSKSLSLCKTFPEVFNEFIRFIGEEKAILCVWGTADIKELLKNIKYHNLNYLSLPLEYIDIQQHASKALKAPKGCRIGLKSSVEMLNISINNDFHDAFNDAYYTSKVFKHIYNPSIKPLVYTLPISRRNKIPKSKIDNTALIKQFEKMYNRRMSQEEISIIKLAYTMGKTNQFLVK
ncbi:3'-5' exonuclease [Clostridium carnis]